MPAENININKYKGFEFPNKRVHDDQTFVHYTGYDYSKTLIRKSVSPYLYNNKKLAGFLDTLNDIMVHMVNSVKYIRNYFNYAVPKDYQKIN